MKRTILISILALAGALGSAKAGAGAAQIRITGSETMKGFGERLAQWYQKKNPGTQFTVTSMQLPNGFAAMSAGNVEIVQSGRRVLHSESQALLSSRGKNYVEVQVANEIAGIAVNPGNPVKELSLYQLREVLSGKVKNWKQLGGTDQTIKIYGRDDTSGVRAFLEEEFMGDESIFFDAATFPNNSGLLAAISRDPGGIGFGTVELRPDTKVRFLGIKASGSGEAVAPTGEAIRGKQYKLSRPLYFYFAGPPQGELLQFARWALSPEGQLVVEAVGYYPLSSAEREEGMRALAAK